MEQMIKLSILEGISGAEEQVAKEVARLLKPYCPEVYQDVLGNVVGVMGKGRGERVMLEAHMDEIGLMVKEIDPQGFVTFLPIGGINPATLPAAEVIVHGSKRLFGVIGAKPPHLQSEDESKENYKIEDMYIDLGLSASDLAGVVHPGDAVTFSVQPARLLNGRLSSKSLDNRMGIWCLVELAKRFFQKDLDKEIIFLAAVQEEVGCRGAKVGAYHIDPDYAVVLDVTHAVTPYTDSSDTAFPLGSGAAIAVGPNLDKPLTQRLLKAAENLPHTVEVCAGNTGTDAWVVQTTKKGIPTALVSVPLRYMHTQVETLSMEDVRATADCVYGLIKGGTLC